MALLKTAVIVMGVLIFAGIAVVGVTLVNRVGGASSPAAANARIELPPGARVVETRIDGKTILMRVTLADGKTQLRLYDLDGKLTSMIEIVETK
jgi:hypothetical protein